MSLYYLAFRSMRIPVQETSWVIPRQVVAFGRSEWHFILLRLVLQSVISGSFLTLTMSAI